MPGEPGALVLTLYDKLIDRIKNTRPQRTDGKNVTTDIVFSQMSLGLPIDPRDFKNPWSPIGGATLQDAAHAAGATPTAPAAGTPFTPGTPGAATPPPTGGTTSAASPAGGAATATATATGTATATATATTATGTATAAPAAPSSGAATSGPDPRFRRAIASAFNTSQLVDHAIMVTNDDSFREYRQPRHISFAYENIINGMQPTPMPPVAPEVQQQIDEARKVLYELDEDGEISGKSTRYKNYIANAEAYARAKKDYADAQVAAMADPAKAETWPQDSVFFQQQVDEAWDTFKTEGAEKVERALDIIESVGVSMQDRMVAKARKLYDAWNLGIAGVPTTIPYSYIMPSGWADANPPDEDDGWTHLEISSAEYTSHTHEQSDTQTESHSSEDHKSTSAGGFLGFIGLAGEGNISSSDQSWSSSTQTTTESDFKNDATNLTIELSYALCEIERPWLLGDVFYMRNWYLVNNPKNSISDGTVGNQVEDEKPLLPLIPTHFLAIRNVSISSTQWGDDGKRLESTYGRSSTSTSASGGSAEGGISLGAINFGASHSSGRSSSDSSSDSGEASDDVFHSTFENDTLTIYGTQVIAWLGDIVPAAAPLDDPNLAGGPH